MGDRLAEIFDVPVSRSVAVEGIGMAELKGQMSQFERGNRRSRLYGDCMRAKGYRQN